MPRIKKEYVVSLGLRKKMDKRGFIHSKGFPFTDKEFQLGEKVRIRWPERFGNNAPLAVIVGRSSSRYTISQYVSLIIDSTDFICGIWGKKVFCGTVKDFIKLDKE